MKRLFFVILFVLAVASAIQGCREEGKKTSQKEELEEKDTTVAPPYQEEESDFD